MLHGIVRKINVSSLEDIIARLISGTSGANNLDKGILT